MQPSDWSKCGVAVMHTLFRDCILTYVDIAHCLYKFTLSYTFHALIIAKKQS